jgi:hypothetical protein
MLVWASKKIVSDDEYDTRSYFSYGNRDGTFKGYVDTRALPVRSDDYSAEVSILIRRNPPLNSGGSRHPLIGAKRRWFLILSHKYFIKSM